MLAMRAEEFRGYDGLKLVDMAKPAISDGKVLLRMTAPGVTPLEHTILSSQYYRAKVPLLLGSEGAGVVEEGGGTDCLTSPSWRREVKRSAIPSRRTHTCSV